MADSNMGDINLIPGTNLEANLDNTGLHLNVVNLYNATSGTIPGDTLIAYGTQEPGEDDFNPTNCKIYIQYSDTSNT